MHLCFQLGEQQSNSEIPQTPIGARMERNKNIFPYHSLWVDVRLSYYRRPQFPVTTRFHFQPFGSPRSPLAQHLTSRISNLKFEI
jgi:hypothetical protein